MFICESCHNATECPVTHLSGSNGKCEFCGRHGPCHECVYRGEVEHKTEWRIEYERMARALSAINERTDELVTHDVRPVKGKHVLVIGSMALDAIKDLSLGNDFEWEGRRNDG